MTESYEDEPLADVERAYAEGDKVMTKSPSRTSAEQHSRPLDGSANLNSAPCGNIVAGGCKVYDPECGACQAVNSDAPEWTL